MNRGVQVVALVVSLVSMLSDVAGQEAVWRPIERPANKSTRSPAASGVTVRAQASDLPGASLGRPMPTTRGTSGVGEPAPFPAAYQSAIPLAQHDSSTGIEPIATVAPPGTVIAASTPSASPPSAPLPLPASITAPTSPAPAVPVPPTDPPDQGPTDLFAAERHLPQPQQPGELFLGVVKTGTVEEITPVANWVGDRYPADGVSPAPPPPDASVFMPQRPASTFYAGAEYLLWWVKPDHAPPLLTTGDAQTGANAGALGQASTVILDNGDLTHNPMSGGRFYGGWYFDGCGDKAIEVGGFFLGQTSNNLNVSSANNPVLTRPFFNANQGMQTVEQVAFPGVASGSASVNSPSQLWGLEANMLCKWCCGCDYRVSLLGGIRYLDLQESVTITENVQNDPGGPNPFNGTLVGVTDQFSTHNQFYGGQVGAEGRWYFCPGFSLDGRFTLAMGDTHQTLTIAGSQQFPPGTPNVSPLPGGLLALNSNIGTFTRDRFSVVPELRLNVGYNVTDNIRLSVGYNFLYWTNVIRPGEQIDTTVDITRIPNFVAPPGTMPLATPRPAVLFKESDFWAQGLIFGIEITY